MTSLRANVLVLLALVGVGCIGLAGCTFGPSAKEVAPANSAAGIGAALSVEQAGATTDIRGELLEAGSEALIVLSEGQLVQIPYAAIARGAFEPVGRLRIRDGRAPSGEKLRQLQLLSRYPQGISSDVMRRLLSLHHQDELRRLP